MPGPPPTGDPRNLHHGPENLSRSLKTQCAVVSACEVTRRVIGGHLPMIVRYSFSYINVSDLLQHVIGLRNSKVPGCSAPRK